jgi:hypothetical protein
MAAAATASPPPSAGRETLSVPTLVSVPNGQVTSLSSLKLVNMLEIYLVMKKTASNCKVLQESMINQRQDGVELIINALVK